MMRNVLTSMLGVRFGLTRPYGQGILSPICTPYISRQRGQFATAERTEAHTHPIQSYHGRYHGLISSPGFKLLGERGGGSWSRKSRPTVDTHPLQTKLLWEDVA